MRVRHHGGCARQSAFIAKSGKGLQRGQAHGKGGVIDARQKVRYGVRCLEGAEGRACVLPDLFIWIVQKGSQRGRRGAISHGAKGARCLGPHTRAIILKGSHEQRSGVLPVKRQGVGTGSAHCRVFVGQPGQQRGGRARIPDLPEEGGGLKTCRTGAPVKAAEQRIHRALAEHEQCLPRARSHLRDWLGKQRCQGLHRPNVSGIGQCAQLVASLRLPAKRSDDSSRQAAFPKSFERGNRAPHHATILVSKAPHQWLDCAGVAHISKSLGSTRTHERVRIA